MNYERDVRIDDSALDVEWLEQPQLMMKYSRYAADAGRVLEQRKEQLEVTRAELDKKIRSDPENFDIAKVTESVVANTIITQSEYREAQEAMIEAKHEYDMARAAVRSIDGKKDALENLVRLHGQQYFAGPSVPRDLSKEWEEKQRQKQADTKVKIKRRK